MCGVGLLKFYKNKPSKEFLIECGNIINNEQSKRGPNHKALWISNDQMTMICHQRLAILDLTTSSNQPFENDLYVGSYNGEIYNYLELSNDLNDNCNSDTIYLKHSLDSKNFPKKLEEFDGPFSLIIYNKKTKKVTFARDRYGEKPIYYFKNENYLIIASQLKSLILLLKKLNYQYSFNKKNINRTIVYGFDINNSTPINGIKSLKKGSYAFDNQFNNSFEIKSYCKKINRLKIEIKKNKLNILFKEYFEESINQKLRSDVPIGIFLSGGLDSTLIACAIRKVFNKEIESYTIDFPGTNQKHFKRSKLISKELGIENNQIVFNSNNALESLKILPQSITSFYSDPAQLPLLSLSKFASKKTPVVLGGDGADELFNGYERYKRFRIINFLRNNKFQKLIPIFDFLKPDNKLRRYRESLSAESSYLSYLNIFNFWEGKPPLFKSNSFKSKFNFKDPCLIDQDFYLPEVILRKSDGCTMQFGIEARLPYLSNKLILLSKTIRNDFPKLRKKDIFLSLLKDYIGEKIYYEYKNMPKEGLTMPLQMIFMDQSIISYMNNFFTYEVISKFEFLDSEKIFTIWDNIRKKKKLSNLYGMWALFTFLQWSKQLDKGNN